MIHDDLLMRLSPNLLIVSSANEGFVMRLGNIIHTSQSMFVSTSFIIHVLLLSRLSKFASPLCGNLNCSRDC